MPKGSGENGFIVFAKWLRSQTPGYEKMGWKMFIEEKASQAWKDLTHEEREEWKYKSRHQRIELDSGKRQLNSRQLQRLAGCDEENIIEDDVMEEIEILDRFPAKRNRNIKDMIEKWEWSAQGKIETMPFILISCQEFSQEVERTGRMFQYYPAEISAVEFTLSEGVKKEYHSTFPFIGAWKDNLDAGMNGWHGVEAGIPTEVDKEEHLKKIHDFYNEMMDWGIDRRNHVFCFEKEFLVVAGCLEYVAEVVDGERLIPWCMKRMVCVEDLFTAIVKFSKLDSIDPEHVRDFSQLAKESQPIRRCPYHEEKARKSKNDKHICGLNMVRIVVSLMRKWISNQAIDSEVIKRQSEELEAGGVESIVPEEAPFQKVANFILTGHPPAADCDDKEETLSHFQSLPTSMFIPKLTEARPSVGAPQMQNPSLSTLFDDVSENDMGDKCHKTKETLVQFSGFSIPTTIRKNLPAPVPTPVELDCDFGPDEFKPPTYFRSKPIVSVAKAAPLNWITLQRSMPVGERGIGRGGRCIDWMAVKEMVVGARLVFPNRK